ncbi:MAG: TlyA family RNA methyltransferase [Candidatus Dormibacteria bacterium]
MLRLDQALVARGLVSSRARAQAMIRAGMVKVDGEAAAQADQRVVDESELSVATPRTWVSRGAEKLTGALNDFAIEVQGRICLDAGASTGGFTEVLLSRGASRVYAVDVGYGQLDWRLRQDPRVVVMERVNIRELETLPGDRPGLAVGDLSFISLRKVVPSILRVCQPGVEMVLLVKPQFELGPGRVGKGGIVRDPEDREEAVDAFVAWAVEAGIEVFGRTTSPITGARGNVEFFVHLRGPA